MGQPEAINRSVARSCPTLNQKFDVVEKLPVEPFTLSLWNIMPKNEVEGCLLQPVLK